MFGLLFVQMFAHLYINLGPTRLRRWILDRIPSTRVQELKGIVDTMDRQSREIFNSKKAALEKGDEAVSHQIGEGKDILSVMSERLCFRTMMHQN